MSISLMVRSGAEMYEVPLAGQRTFTDMWRPAALRLGLTRLGKVDECPIRVTPEVVPLLLEEVALLRRHLEALKPSDPLAAIADDVRRLELALARLKVDTGYSASLG